MGAMPITDQHLEYAAALPVWLRHRDVLRGEDAVKARGPVYLARMDGMSDEDYRAYVQRACFFNATARTAAGMVGMIFRRDARTSIDEKAINLADVDLAGTSFTNYAKELVSEVVATGRCGTHIDIVQANARTANNDEVFCGLEHLFGDLGRRPNHQCVCTNNGFEKLLRGQPRTGINIKSGSPQGGDSALGEWFSNQDTHLRNDRCHPPEKPE